MSKATRILCVIQALILIFGVMSYSVCALATNNLITVSFNANGGSDIDPINVTFGERYGKLPSSAITGLSGGNSNWYLVDDNGNVTDTKITSAKKVEIPNNHELFVKRKVLAPSVKLALTVPGGISDGYQYYIPDNSTRVLTATVSNKNDDVLSYNYEWYKDDVLLENESDSVLTLNGNVSDSGTYKVKVTATLKDSAGIIVTEHTATAEKEQKVKIMHSANTLYYDANGGKDGPSSNYTGGTSITVASTQPTRENYTFLGWNTLPDGTGTHYNPNDSFIFENDNGNGGCSATLYAQWLSDYCSVTFMVDGQIYKTVSVKRNTAIGELPAFPFDFEQYKTEPYWDADGVTLTEETVITADTTVNAVYELIEVESTEEITTTEKSEDGSDETPKTTAKPQETAVASENTETTEKTTSPNENKTTSAAVEDKESVVPKTGDNTNILLLFAVFVVGVGMLIVINSGKRNKFAVK